MSDECRHLIRTWELTDLLAGKSIVSAVNECIP